MLFPQTMTSSRRAKEALALQVKYCVYPDAEHVVSSHWVIEYRQDIWQPFAYAARPISNNPARAAHGTSTLHDWLFCV